MVRVSAIISAYYAEEFLAGRLKNLLAQSERPEIVVVCQKDSEEHRIATLMLVVESNPVHRLVLTDDTPTIYEAWNQAVKFATGEYITNANSDDRLYPGALKRMANTLERNPDCGLVYSNVDIVEEIGGKPTGCYRWAEGDFDVLMKGCFVGPMPMWRKSLHDKYGLFDNEYRIAGDYEYWLRLAVNGEKFYHITDALGAYLKRKDSAEHREELRAVWETARARGKYRQNLVRSR